MKQKLFSLFVLLLILKASISYAQPAKLQISNISYPNPMNLNVGNVGEYVYAIQNIGNVHSKIDSIIFQCTANPNIEFYPIGHPVYYLTGKDSLLTGYFTIYNYPYTISSPHNNSYPLDTSGLNRIKSSAFYGVIDTAYLQAPDTVFIHIPFFVKNCNEGRGYNNFYLDTTATLVDTNQEETYVNVNEGTPSVTVSFDTTLIKSNNATFCDAIHKYVSEIKFIYRNNGIPDTIYPPGNARLDSMRIYVYCNTLAGIIDVNSIKINDTVVLSSCISTYTSGGMNIYVIDLTKYPATHHGHPFGINTISDMSGGGHADALAEDSSFYITANFIYDTISCPPYAQLAGPTTFDIPGIWVNYSNMCFTKTYDRTLLLPFSSIKGDAEYLYSSNLNPKTYINAPSDIVGAFNLTACPDFNQNWSPTNFGFDCPNAYWTLVVPLPKGYHLNSSSSELTPHSSSSDTNEPNIYNYYPPVYDISICSSDSFLMPQPLISEHFHINSTEDTIFVNYGKLPISPCPSQNEAITNLPPCVNIPLTLDCSAFPDTNIYTASDDILTFQLQYICDSGCSSCPNILTADTTLVYHHCNGTCTSIPYTDNGWIFRRTNIGDSNVNPPTFYSTCNSPAYPNNAFLVKDTLPLNYNAAYPGDQVEAQVNGGYGFVPSGYSNEYLQIRYESIPSDPHYLFELDPTSTSYFIMHGCTGVPALNGVQLILPSASSINYGGVGAPVEMDFSINSAIYNYSPHLDTLWRSDTHSENDTISAYIHLRVLPHTLNPGINLLNLRTEYMCTNTSMDSIHSCDSWGTRFDIYQPGTPSAKINLDSPYQTSCDSLTFNFGFITTGALQYVTGGDDFPDEFRPYAELDSIVIIWIPKGYIYSSSQFIISSDRYDTNRTNNHFKGGLINDTLPISLFYRNNHSNNTDSITEIAFKGLSPLKPCWPIIDQKSDGSGDYSNFGINVTVKPVCYAPDTCTLCSYAGYIEGTQQSDTSFQIKVKPQITSSIILHHNNPIIKLDYPLPINNYNDSISFKFDICEIGGFNATVPWVAIENVDGYLFDIASATIYDSTTNHLYHGNVYYNSDSGAIFNLGDIPGNHCNTLIFSALINDSSRACPPPHGGDTGKVVVRFGSICNGVLKNPDSTTCENKADTFYYYVYPTNLELAVDSSSPSPVSLCGGTLTEYLTITSADLGTITNPLFWVVPQAGDSIVSISFTQPCGGPNDTTIHAPDTLKTNGSGAITEVGWNLNRDLKIDGLRGTLGLPPGSNLNTICVKLILAMNCDYHGKPIIDSVSGISTCNKLITASASLTPSVDSSCCSIYAHCLDTSNYVKVLKNPTASLLSYDSLGCEKVLIEGTFTVDKNFYFTGCDVSLAPKALINVVNNATLFVEQGVCKTSSGCSHLHAACDTMWRGIFVNPGSTLFTIDETLIEDADTAVYAMNTSSSEGLYQLTSSTFNKNYKDIVVSPYVGAYNSTSQYCIYTCRNYDSILSSSPYNCVSTDASGNWGHAPFTTLIAPFTGQRTAIGWEIDTVALFTDSISTTSGINTFDNLTEGILGNSSSMIIYSDRFQYINSGNYSLPAIFAFAQGAMDTLIVGRKGLKQGNTFRHCTTGVMATEGFNDINISYNNFHFDTTIVSTTLGIYISGPMMSTCAMTIDSNTIDSASIGVLCVLNKAGKTLIDSNTIVGSNSCAMQVGVMIAEFGGPIVYSVKNNSLRNIGYGVYAGGLINDTVSWNTIFLNDTLCTTPVATGIGIFNDNGDQIIGNTISMNNHSNASDYTADIFTGIYAESSTACRIACNQAYYLKNHLLFYNDQNFNVWNNSMTAGKNDSAIGIELMGATTALGNQVRGVYSSDNEWIDTTNFHCTSYVIPPTNPAFSTFFIRNGAIYNPDGSSCTPPVLTFPDTTSSPSPCSPTFMMMDMALMDTIARNKITYLENPDTASRIAKQGLTGALWNKKYLLSEPVLRNFNDSISSTSLGQLMIADTSINSVQNIDPSTLLANVMGVSPSNNIESDLQTTAQIHLQARVARTRKLLDDKISTLRILANKCPSYDGVGVYQARTLLAYYNGEFTVYGLNNCPNHRDYLHKPKKQNGKTTENIEFNLYPNPNNGTFTITYNLGNENTGRVEIYNQIGMKIAEYLLTSVSGNMQVNAPNFSQSLYIYKVFTDTGIKKVGKMIIIK